MRSHHVRPYGPSVTKEERRPDTTGASSADHNDCQQYEIRVTGHLGSRWTAWFDGLSITNEDDGTTVICGPMVDQAALHGVLQKLRDLGVALVSFTRLPPDAQVTSTVSRHAHPTPKGN